MKKFNQYQYNDPTPVNQTIPYMQPNGYYGYLDPINQKMYRVLIVKNDDKGKCILNTTTTPNIDIAMGYIMFTLVSLITGEYCELDKNTKVSDVEITTTDYPEEYRQIFVSVKGEKVISSFIYDIKFMPKLNPNEDKICYRGYTIIGTFCVGNTRPVYVYDDRDMCKEPYEYYYTNDNSNDLNCKWYNKALDYIDNEILK